MKRIYVLLLALAFSLNLSAQSNFWSLSQVKNDHHFTPATRMPEQYKSYEVDYIAIVKHLQNAPDYRQKSTNLSIEVPDETGQFELFHLYKSGTMSSDLQKAYPNISAYRGYSDNGKDILSLTTGDFGVQIGILRQGRPDLIIQSTEKSRCLVYTKNQLPPIPFQCLTQEEYIPDTKPSGQRIADERVRIYRFGIGTTAEYSQYHINRAIQAGSLAANATDAEKKAAVLAAVVTTIDRVNSVYERDFGVILELVNNETNAIFLDPNTDPYDNTDIMSMLYANTSALNNALGANNYDGGHLFTTYAGGGISGLGIICSSSKGRSVTGSTNPVGDAYDIDYVAHEIGHAFGCNHTFANSCGNNRHIGTSVEPGSGSTIMAYAGVCSPNVQPHSDAYFQTVSIEECSNFVINHANCAQIDNIGNHNPVINIVQANTHIPSQTPFMLKASANDNDNDNLTYCWEEIDPITNSVVTYRPNANYNNGPAFRSYAPKASGIRYFPQMSNLINHQYQNSWEVLPAVQRNLSFAVTVRDNHPGGGTTPKDVITLQVDAQSGPFRITSQTRDETWVAGQTAHITWDVANTQNNPVNCQSIDILISTDNGASFSQSIATDVPNTGNADVVVPSLPIFDHGLLMIKGHNNYFFDLAKGRIKLTDAAQSEKGLASMLLFPVPAQSLLNIRFFTEYPEQATQFVLYDLSGREVLSQHFEPNANFNHSIKVANFASGVYYIKMQNGDDQITKKILIK